VTLTGFVGTGAESVFAVTKAAGTDGTATFSAVPRSVSGAAVSVVADASLEESTTSDGCTFTHRWTGASDPTQVAAATSVEVLASRQDDSTCDPPGADAPTFAGTILDADGLPFSVSAATVSMHRADGADWERDLPIDEHGGFSVRVQPWGTPDAPAQLTLRVVGEVTATEADGDCTIELAPELAKTLDVTLARGGTLAPVVALAGVHQVGEVCGTTGTPKPSATASGGTPRPTASATATARATATAAPAGVGTGGTDRPTLPPTDTANVADGRTDVANAAFVAVAAGIVAFGLLLVARSRREGGAGR